MRLELLKELCLVGGEVRVIRVRVEVGIWQVRSVEVRALLQKFLVMVLIRNLVQKKYIFWYYFQELCCRVSSVYRRFWKEDNVGWGWEGIRISIQCFFVCYCVGIFVIMFLFKLDLGRGCVCEEIVTEIRYMLDVFVFLFGRM